jgi:hypothetical protein
MHSAFLLLALLPVQPQTPPMVAAADPLALIQTYNEATRTFRPDLLEAVFAPDYTEVSPVGEVDERAKVIRFYPAGQTTNLKAIRLEEPLVRRYGDIAVVIGKTVFETQRGSMALRTTFVCRRQKKRWWLVSSQFTGIRPPVPPAKKAN